MTRVTENEISLELPNDWELWNQNRWAGSDTKLAAKYWKKKWPNIEVTDVGQVTGGVQEARRFAHRWVKRQGAELLDERFIDVDGFEAYEFCYKQRVLFRTFHFCKVSVIVKGHEYLIQLASRDLAADKSIFDRIVESVRLDFAHR